MISLTAAVVAGFLVWGDSQSIAVLDGKANQAWPHVVTQYTGVPLQNVSRAGRKFGSGDLLAYLRSADIVRNNNVRGVILWAGTNDAIWEQTPNPLDLALLMAEMRERELELVCVKPPTLPAGAGQPAQPPLLDTWREFWNACPHVWDANEWQLIYGDGAHLTAVGHWRAAVGVYFELKRLNVIGGS